MSSPAELKKRRHGELPPERLVAEATAYVRSSYPRLRDPEDKGQQAFVELTKRIAEGKPVDDPLAMIKTIAWRLANDEVSSKRSATFKAVPIDPSGPTVTSVADDERSAEDRLISGAERARARAVVQELPAELAAAYIAKYVDELSTKDAIERLGIPQSTYFHRLGQVHKRVHESLESAAFSKLQLKLYTALRDNRPSRLRDRALELQQSDPVTAARFRELEHIHQGLAATLPPVALTTDSKLSLFERLGESFAAARDRLASIGSDGGQATAETATTIASSGAGRGSGAAAGGALATITGALGVKGAALCAGGAAVACVAAIAGPGLTPFGGESSEPLPANEAGASDAQDSSKAPRLAAPNPALVSQPQPVSPDPQETPKEAGNADGSKDGGGAAGNDPAGQATPRSAPTPAQPSAPTDPGAYNPYNTASPATPAPAPSSAPASDSSGGGGSSGGCNPYDSTC